MSSKTNDDIQKILRKEENTIEDIDFQQNNEVFATYLATSLIVIATLTQFSNRSNIQESTRVVVDAIGIGLALLILLWAFVARFRGLTKKMHETTLMVMVFLIALVYFLLLVLVFYKVI